MLDMAHYQTMLEVLKIRFWSSIRIILGLVGFGIIAYSLVGLYNTHQEVRGTQLLINARYETIFTAAAETDIILFGIGAFIVLFAVR